MAKTTIFLWYDKDAEAAARFYTRTFPGGVDSEADSEPNVRTPRFRRAGAGAESSR